MNQILGKKKKGKRILSRVNVASQISNPRRGSAADSVFSVTNASGAPGSPKIGTTKSTRSLASSLSTQSASMLSRNRKKTERKIGLGLMMRRPKTDPGMSGSGKSFLMKGKVGPPKNRAASSPQAPTLEFKKRNRIFGFTLSRKGTSPSASRMKRSNKKEDVLKSFKEKGIDSGYNFSAVNMDQNSLVDAAYEMLYVSYCHRSRDAKKLASKREPELRSAILQFVTSVESMYSNSAFHNFSHAVDVTQMMYTFIMKYFKHRIGNKFFDLIVSCLCHDISHPGGTTNFLKDYKCLFEGDTLEQFHISETEKLVKSGLDLFSMPFMNELQREELIFHSKTFIEATDISQDVRFKEEASKVRGTFSSGENLPIEYLNILMKISDLANIVRNFDDAYKWSLHLKIEMQAEAKFKENIDLIEHLEQENDEGEIDYQRRIWNMQKKLGVLQVQVRNQEGSYLNFGLKDNTIGFINAIVKPLSEFLRDLDEDAHQEYSRRLRSNLLNWRQFA